MSHTNGYVEGNSPNSSQLSSEGNAIAATGDATLISRTQKQHTTQQVHILTNIKVKKGRVKGELTYKLCSNWD
jgi:hypothetical protein